MIFKILRSIFTENLPFQNLVDKQKSSDQNQFFKKRNSKNKKSKEEEINFGGSLALVPLVDMINHSPDAQVYFLI